MLNEIGNFFHNYIELITEYPYWITLIFFVLHLVALIVCFSFNKKDSDKLTTKSSHNTLHTNFWALTIIALPITGIVLYFLGSVLPYILKKTSKNSNPFSVKVGSFSWKFLLVVFLLSSVAALINQAEDVEIYRNIYSLAMSICFVDITVDFFKNFKNKSIFLKLSYFDTTEDENKIEVKPFFDKKHFIEKDIAESDDVVLSLARSAGDCIIPNNKVPDSTKIKLFPPNINLYYDDKKIDYTYLYKNNEFKKTQSDIIDAEYMGKGVTKYTVASWSKDEICTEQTMYNVSPKPLYFLLRSAVLSASYFLIFSPYVADFNIKVISLFDKLLGGLK